MSNQLKNYPNRPLIKEADQATWITGAVFRQDIEKIQEELTALKIGYQDLILVCLDNSAAYPELMQALWSLGAIVHPISGTTPSAQIMSEFKAHDYVGLIVEDHLQADLQSAFALTEVRTELATSKELTFLGLTKTIAMRAKSPRAEVREDDLALILNTSGTTGKPKRVGLTHRIMLNAARHDAVSQEMSEKDTTMIMMPMFHINAQVMSVLSTRISGGKILVTPKFSASNFWRQVAENQVTWGSIVPTIVSILLLNEKANAQYKQYQAQIHLRFLRSSSFALPENKLVAFQENYHTQILEGYGMTEASSQCTINPLKAPKIGSAGKAFGTDVAIIEKDGFHTIDTGIGEIAIRGDHVIHDYMDPNPSSFKDGWFLTGDLGYFDKDGYLFVKGRKKEMISRGGEKVAPAFVENVLNELDFIAQVAVIGMPDDIYGEEVTAVVKSRQGAPVQAIQKKAIKELAAKKLASYERPTRIEFVNEFPLNATGKILRPKLMDWLENKQLEEISV